MDLPLYQNSNNTDKCISMINYPKDFSQSAENPLIFTRGMMMRRVIFIITFVFCCLLPSAVVYAEVLNEYEQQVIAEAKRTYVYKGKEYRVSANYIDQLTAYLSQADVDITAEQRDQALQLAYDRIEQGVREGYLVPVEEPMVTPTPSPTVTIAPEGLQPVGETELTTSEQSGTAEEEASQVPLPKTTPKVLNKENTQKEPSVKPEEIKKLFEVTPEKETEAVSNPEVTLDTLIITETGFCLNNTLYVIVGVLILMIIGFIATIRLDYFAYDDE